MAGLQCPVKSSSIPSKKYHTMNLIHNKYIYIYNMYVCMYMYMHIYIYYIYIHIPIDGQQMSAMFKLQYSNPQKIPKSR